MIFWSLLQRTFIYFLPVRFLSFQEPMIWSLDLSYHIFFLIQLGFSDIQGLKWRPSSLLIPLLNQACAVPYCYLYRQSRRLRTDRSKATIPYTCISNTLQYSSKKRKQISAKQGRAFRGFSAEITELLVITILIDNLDNIIELSRKRIKNRQKIRLHFLRQNTLL